MRHCLRFDLESEVEIHTSDDAEAFGEVDHIFVEHDSKDYAHATASEFVMAAIGGKSQFLECLAQRRLDPDRGYEG